MSDLPKTWSRCKLGDVIDYGRTLKAEPNEIRDDEWVLELEDIEKDSSRLLQRLTFNERKSKSTKNRFRQGDVLYGKLRPYLNKVVRADCDGVSTTEIVPLSPTPELNSGFLFYWLKHPTFLDYVNAVSHGLNMPRLGTEAGRKAPFVLAPLPEQQRIADKLDSLLSRVDSCRERLDRVPSILKRFRQSVLAAATSGKLTEEGGGKAELIAEGGRSTSKWTTKPVAELCKKGRIITYGVIKLGSESENGVPCLRTSNVRWLHVDIAGVKRIDKGLSDNYSRTILQGGEVLVNVRGTLGGVATVTQDMIGWNVSREVAVVPSDKSRIDSDFLAYSIASEQSQRWLSGVEKGVAYTGINIADLKKLPVAFPPLDVQRQIVERTKALFDMADEFYLRYEIAVNRVASLAPSLLAKAFRGELVPQDLNDESASVLLKRIRAAKPDTKKKTSKRKAKAK